jgi:hypothetical protein
MKQNITSEPAVTIVEAEGDISPDRDYETEIAVPEGATHALVLVERLSGGRKVKVDLSGLTADELGELSNLEQVRARFLRLASSTESIAIRVSSSAKALYRVTVAFVKREVTSARKNFSCRACKQLCRLAVSVMLAHLGIPYLDAEATVEMPEILPPDETTAPRPPFRSTDDLFRSLEGKSTVPVQVGQPVPLGAECRAMLEDPASAPAWVRELFELIDPKAMKMLRAVLDVLNWVSDASDRIYTALCGRLGMCPGDPKPG